MNHEIKLIHGLMRDALESSSDPITLDWTSAKAVVAALDQRAELLSVLQEFIQVNRVHGYEFDSNEPTLWEKMLKAKANAEAP